MTHKVYEEFLNEFLPTLNGPTIFELGLHRGEDTKEIFGLCSSPKYHGFEPDPRNISEFKKQEICKKINFVEGAVANYDGTGMLNQSSGTPSYHNIENTCSSSLYKPKEHLKRWPWTKFEKQVEVKTYTLDSYCDSNGISSIDFIWSDIQGGEYYMILGAQNILRNTKYIFMEYENAELFEGHKKLSEIMAALPGKWELVKNYHSEILVKNKSLGM